MAITFSYLFVDFHMEPTPPPSTYDHLNMSPSPPFGRHKWMVISILPECRPSHFQITGGPKCLVPRYVGGPFAVMYRPPTGKAGWHLFPIWRLGGPLLAPQAETGRRVWGTKNYLNDFLGKISFQPPKFLMTFFSHFLMFFSSLYCLTSDI